MIAGVLFDNDGTLVDTHDIILASMRFSTRKVLNRRIPDDELMSSVGIALADQMKLFTSDEAEQVELLRVYREHNAGIHDEGIRAFPGAAAGLEALAQRGLRLGVVTSKLRTTAWHGLEVVGLAPYFGCCIGAEDCREHKPEPEPILRGAEALGLAPQECVYVGDAPVDLKAGRAAGSMTAAALWGMFDAEVLRAESPDLESKTFGEMVQSILDLVGDGGGGKSAARSPSAMSER